MPRPILKLKTRPESAKDCPKCSWWLSYRISHDDMHCAKCGHHEAVERDEHPDLVESQAPEGWIKGQLLNIRRTGTGYILTLLNEEFDPQHPERSLSFDNPMDCQAFISSWYARDSHDPRAG